ncbi:unnamed protein product [Vitrella brassicaformis CCMP3155]|uniref:Acetyl-coenzyme A transporter 1 n=2 Tax=Vitrella brassicaformis TaxID=1169539 RepID=A0A0G4EQD7_VITBC|nr:unnamed protein product [Vitrella brassicaformis CCMP3155]|eukprot:CEL99644.1 unnamed protein product [Vitrella brassicaformis CCMP3155]
MASYRRSSKASDGRPAASDSDPKSVMMEEKTPAAARSPQHGTKGPSSVSSSISAVLGGDVGNIALLLVLYTLQGIPMGLSASIPFLLQDRVSYKQQALFSCVSLPFSLKLLWAPIVDSMYWKQMGRRKSWLIPVQLGCGLLMVWGSYAGRIDHWLGSPEEKPDVLTLTVYFVALYFLMSTQDIAVDGWALTILSKRNKGYASTCNTIGQTAGYFIAHVAFLALNDPATCNTFFRSTPLPHGLVTLASFLHFWGLVFLATTTFIWAFKREKPPGATTTSRKVEPTTAQFVMSVEETTTRSTATAMGASPSTGTNRGAGPSSQFTGAATTSAADRPPYPPPNFTPSPEPSPAPSPDPSPESRRGSLADDRKHSLMTQTDGDGVEWEGEGGGGGGGGGSGGGGAVGGDWDEIDGENPGSVAETYGHLWKVMWLGPVQTVVLVLMTCRLPFAVTDSSTHLKLVEYGMSKEELAFLAPLLIPSGILTPMALGRYTAGARPMNIFLRGMPFRLIIGALFAVFLPLTRAVYATKTAGSPPYVFYVFILLVGVLYDAASNCMFVAQMAFFAKISDPSIGGTYMTFLNTIANLGGKWTTTLSLWLMDPLTIRRCPDDQPLPIPLPIADDSTSPDAQQCPVLLDGYTVQLAICFVIGVLWMWALGSKVKRLQELPEEAWHIPKTTTTTTGTAAQEKDGVVREGDVGRGGVMNGTSGDTYRGR